jgi:murein DD-endopeptidase MepM/ murein hydrolase activator NlpD
MRAGSLHLSPLVKLAALILSAAGLGTFGLAVSAPAPLPAAAAAPFRLPAMRAVGIRTDTLFVGGYARGSFTQAMQLLASDLSPAERELVGQHLDRIFTAVLPHDGLGRGGRLRVAYERAVRPDGTTRSIRVLTAEAAVAGEMHTAFYFEQGGKPGYYDPFGRTLEEHAWARPLAGLRVTSAFGSRRMHPILHRILPHTGIDYGARYGTPVHVTADGVVTRAGRNGGYGNMVEVQHPNGYSTRYAHLSRIATRRGHLVHQGDLIGYVGMTGLATGPHLHYEVRRNGHPVDPNRVTETTIGGPELGADPAWPVERHKLSRLLARTPTVLELGATSDGRS